MFYWLIPLLLIAAFLVAIHISFRAPRCPNLEQPTAYDLPFKLIAFKGLQGTLLSAWWIEAAQKSDTTVLILHGWGANKSMMLPLAKPFYAAGFNVLLIDAHNHGDSQKRGVSNMPKFAEDLNSAINWLQKHYPTENQKQIIVGHSVGAAATLLAASQDIHANAFIAISSFAHPKLMMQRYLKRLDVFPGLVTLISSYVQWVIGYRFDTIAPVNTLQQIHKPVLLIHGDADQVIPLSDHLLLCQAAAKQSVECLEIAGADHDSIDKIELHFNKVLNFIEKYLNASSSQN
ncbi:alpha/beta hydrolase [Thiosulfativibrio zosterae]|uniref:Alpha/beta hydrolase n=1 Tax=Thiosulfativibrio zosterae TaxID=2675053 RepID=A0A6F8PMV1_9GAMM|nr:alpha/beta fold hydrolase [Thiosulfativibrio zosterae]BBP43441.1 alpha/beta hydrolase [Thiosulfativibrio zosterae]